MNIQREKTTINVYCQIRSFSYVCAEAWCNRTCIRFYSIIILIIITVN